LKLDFRKLLLNITMSETKGKAKTSTSRTKQKTSSRMTETRMTECVQMSVWLPRSRLHRRFVDVILYWRGFCKTIWTKIVIRTKHNCFFWNLVIWNLDPNHTMTCKLQLNIQLKWKKIRTLLATYLGRQ